MTRRVLLLDDDELGLLLLWFEAFALDGTETADDDLAEKIRDARLE